jgi:nucleoside-diphosphate-sugar epimerase
VADNRSLREHAREYQSTENGRSNVPILVTGGTGLIGAQIVADLRDAGDHVVVMVRNPPPEAERAAWGDVDWFRGDIRDPAQVGALFDEKTIDRVIHLAAFLQYDCENDPDNAVAVNVTGTLNLLRAARKAGASRFVFGSSIAVYGNGAVVFSEDTLPVTPVRIYGQSKLMGECLGERYRALHGLDFVAVRYGGVFGPGGPVKNRGMSALRHELKQTLWGKPADITGASGDECFQYTYVKDAAAATIAAMRRPELHYTVYNVAGPLSNYISLKDFYGAIRSVAPNAGAATFSGKSESGLRVDITRMETDLGIVPRFTVADGLRDELARSRSETADEGHAGPVD